MTPIKVAITVIQIPLSSIASFIKSNTTTASIIPPDNPIKKSIYLSTLFLKIPDKTPPNPVPNTPAIKPIKVTFKIIFFLSQNFNLFNYMNFTLFKLIFGKVYKKAK